MENLNGYIDTVHAREEAVWLCDEEKGKAALALDANSIY
jgi:hypothetical protein